MLKSSNNLMFSIAIIILAIFIIQNQKTSTFTNPRLINSSADTFIDAHLIASNTIGYVSNSYSRVEARYDFPNVPSDMPLKYSIKYDSRCGSIGFNINENHIIVDAGNVGSSEKTIGMQNAGRMQLIAIWYPDGKGESSIVNPFCIATPTTVDFKLMKT